LATRDPEGLATLVLAVGFTPAQEVAHILAPVVVHILALVVVHILVLVVVHILALVVVHILVLVVAHILVLAVALTLGPVVAPTPVQEGLATLVLAVRLMTNGTAPLRTVSDPM
jgi:hypothetical protein